MVQVSDDPLNPRSTTFSGPPLPLEGPPDDWRLITNFIRVTDIVKVFGAWPDDIINPAILQGLYEGEVKTPAGPLSALVGGKIVPTFPFLDETEGSLIQSLVESHKEHLYAPFKSGLLSLGEIRPGLTDAILILLQPLFVLSLRRLEREIGLWERRTPSQKKGTIFALKPGSGATFVRVSAFIGRQDDRVSLPWGGSYREYGKILPLLESRFARLVFQSLDEDLEVIPEGHVIKRMQAAGLVRDHNRGFFGSRWVVALPVVTSREAEESIPTLLEVMQGIRQGAIEVLSKVPELMGSGRYGYLEGHGDYMEMVYAVILGLLCRWAMEDGLIGRPPLFKVTEEGAFVERSVRQRLRGEYPALPGVSIVRDAQAVWDSVVSPWV